jgi:uncharacterized membrane protein YjjB (DUF3815 family)
MPRKNLLLIIDGIVNLILGGLLLFFPAQLIKVFELPGVETFFYVNILGGVLFGIGIALLLEQYSDRLKMSGLGIAGAILINICGAGALVYWLVFENLNLSLNSSIFLWSIAIIVLGVACAEIISKSWLER